MKKEVQLIKKSNGDYIFIPIDEFFLPIDYTSGETIKQLKPCELIAQKPYGWWIETKVIKGGAHDGIGDEHIIREFTEKDFKDILKKRLKVYVSVDYNNRITIPKNGRGDGKIVFTLTDKL